MASPDSRGTWGSRAGFILAAAGSAVGLGNIWGFPTMVGQGGGAVFVLVYLICIFCLCLPILIAELALGRRVQRDPVSVFATIAPGTSWWLVGALGVITGGAILAFYCVIAGWTVAYIWFSLSGAVSGDPAEVAALFARFTASGGLAAALGLGILIVTASILLGGVQSGIERVTKVLMPALFLLMLVLAARAFTLPGASDGLAYYLRPDFSRLFDPTVFSGALGQAFFSLSLGMGTMMTYGSYLQKNEGIGAAALWVVLLDTSVALLAGFIIFPSGFSIPGFDPSASGPGLIFAVLPQLFATLPGGALFGGAFFLLLAVAAITSTISLLEVPVAHAIDAHGWPRRRAVLVLAGVIFLVAIPVALSQGAVPGLTVLPGLGIDFLTLMITIWNNFSLPIGGLLIALFVGHVWKVDRALEELTHQGAWFPAPRLWSLLIRFVCPAAILVIIVAALRPLLGV